MQTVFQTDEYGCGAACLAMLADISYSEARKRLFGRGRPSSSGVTRAPLISALRGYGLEVGASGRLKAGAVVNLRDNALLYGKILPTRGMIDPTQNTYGHWLVWDAEQKVVRDPYKYKKPVWLTSFTVIREK
ncbi:hypothetical protein [Sphingomonas sp.]|jgi:hypothetical protein|uniref:hypothetical protein n=1 Tax=Sphingomonas sp. TaxID=28214 RepID=UPI002ED813FC